MALEVAQATMLCVQEEVHHMHHMDHMEGRTGRMCTCICRWHARIHACTQVHYMEGEVNKMLVDDKGTILLCAFGLPPRSHPDDGD